MLRFRDEKGKLYKAPKGIAFIEVCDAEGNPAVLFAIKGDSEVDVFKAGDYQMANYCAMHGSSQSRLMKVGDSDIWDGKAARNETMTRI